MAKTRMFGGKSYYRHQWMSRKMRAGVYAESLRRKGYNVRVARGENSDGEKGWLLYLRKQA